jgi:hypothetical protein
MQLKVITKNWAKISETKIKQRSARKDNSVERTSYIDEQSKWG